MLTRYPLTLVLLIGFLGGKAQLWDPVHYPQDYFRDPLNIPMSLAANFGELRPNHYHMGLDIRTEHRENLPVLAAADGYISRIVIEPLGFGQAIYLRHPNGYTTVYGHLNKFYPALAAYAEAAQYRLQSWQLSLDIPPGLFNVRKGDLIGLSGNRGGSQGPHLHFEIRRTSDDTNLNPLLFGLPVPDNTSPVIQRLAVYDRTTSVYEQSPRLYPVHKSGPLPLDSAHRLATAENAQLYEPAPALLTVTTARTSFAIEAFDTQSGSANPNGIYQALIYEDDNLLSGFRMNDISYSDTRNINAHIDYRTRELGGPFLQHLSRLPGYAPPSIYRSAGPLTRPASSPALFNSTTADGVVDLSDGAIHVIRIEVCDAYGNSSMLYFRVQYRPSVITSALSSPLTGKEFYPGMLDAFETPDCAFYIAEKSLYDSVHIPFNVADSLPNTAGDLTEMSPLYSIGQTFIPLQEPLLVRIRYKGDKATTHIVMLRSHGKTKEVQQPEWQNGWASARWRSFGDFSLVEDLQPPVITPLGIRAGAVLGKAAGFAFRIKDNLGAIRNFRAELDGKWLCFTNDKELDYIYKFDAHCPPGKHLLNISVEDVAGNHASASYSFTR